MKKKKLTEITLNYINNERIELFAQPPQLSSNIAEYFILLCIPCLTWMRESQLHKFNITSIYPYESFAIHVWSTKLTAHTYIYSILNKLLCLSQSLNTYSIAILHMSKTKYIWWHTKWLPGGCPHPHWALRLQYILYYLHKYIQNIYAIYLHAQIMPHMCFTSRWKFLSLQFRIKPLFSHNNASEWKTKFD